MSFGFDLERDLNVVRFCSIERFKCRSVFVQLRDLNVIRF